MSGASGSGDTGIKKTAARILSYFTRNPKAADTLEGIAKWRLLDEIVHENVAGTQAALEWLVKQGLLVQTSKPGIAPLFRLNPAHAAAPEFDEALQDTEMPSVIIDSMDDATPWAALAPGGATPSTEMSLAVDSSRQRPGGDGKSALVTASSSAFNHTLQRSLASLDLTGFDSIQFWAYSSRRADGAPERPFFLEMKLGSAAVPIDNAANTWQRYLPVTQSKTWEPVRFSVEDLPAPIRSAVTRLQLRCALPGVEFQCNIDDIIGVREEMITDVDAALVVQLTGLSLDGKAVPAVLHPANGALAQARPYFEITQYDIVYCRERSDPARPRGDFTDQGYTLRQPGIAYELFYQVTAVADDRLSQSRMLNFLLRSLPARGELLVNGLPLPMESVYVYPFEQPGGVRTDTIPMFYRISTRQQVGPTERVRAVKRVAVEGDLQLVL